MENYDIDLVGNIFDALEIAKKAHALLPQISPNIKPIHFRILKAIYQIRNDTGSSRISDINNQLGFLLPNTTKVINELVELKVVEKFTTASDKRVVLVHTTELGEEYMRNYIIKYDKALREEFSAIGESDCITMIETINKVYQSMKKVYQNNAQAKGTIHE